MLHEHHFSQHLLTPPEVKERIPEDLGIAHVTVEIRHMGVAPGPRETGGAR
ncbi:MAG: hypothetical protein LJE93_04875 [Acidobacteria bacterium]|nr:hypothetical protein [Acidobacteriota bacterium]